MFDLIPLYQQTFNLQDATFSRIDHADAMVAVVYKVTQPTGTHLILKIHERPNDYFREVYFLQFFRDKLPVPRILQTVPPSTQIHGAILMEFLPGTLLQTKDLTDGLAYEIGSQLAHIHSNRASGYGDLTQSQNLSSDPRIHFTQKFEEGLAECSNHLPQTLLDRCRHYYDTHLNLLTSVDGPCIVHRDFRPGNLIVSQGKLQGIIDWASARVSFAQEDFCSIEHREFLADSSKKKSFLSGYASVRPVPDYRPMIPFLRLNLAIAAVGFTVKRGTWQTSGADLYQFNRRFLDTFF